MKAKVLIDYSRFKYLTSLEQTCVKQKKTDKVEKDPDLDQEDTNQETGKECLGVSLASDERPKELEARHREILNTSMKLQQIAANNVEDESGSPPPFERYSLTPAKKTKPSKRRRKETYWYQGIF